MTEIGRSDDREHGRDDLMGEHAGGLTRRDALTRAAGLGAAALVPAGLLSQPGVASAAIGRAASGTTIQFWDMPWGGPAYENTAQALVNQYNTLMQSKGVTVNYRLLSWETYYETFQTAISSGTTPDVSTGATYQGFQYASALAPLNSVAKLWHKNGTSKDLVLGSLAAQYDSHGKLTGLPWNLDVRVYWYNRELFKKAGVKKLPTSLTELGEVAKALTSAKRKQFGFGMSGDILGAQQLMTMFFTNGGGAYNAKGQANLVQERNIEVIHWLQGLIRAGAMPKEGAGWISTDITAAFQREEIAMTICEPAFYNDVPTISARTQPLEPPTGFHGDRGTIVWHSAMWLYNNSQNKAAATAFLEWWLANESVLFGKGQVTSFPARKSFYTTHALRDPRVEQVIKTYVPVGKLECYPAPHPVPSLNKFEGQSFMQTLAQDVIELKPAKQALSTANEALSQVIATTPA